MTKISYFQRYSQKENHITNNTMLMFQHIYRHGQLRFEQFLQEIMSDSRVDIGLSFNQQVKGKSSIPDGHISQKSLNIYIEAKADGTLYLEQIKRHVKSIKESNIPNNSAILIGLSKNQSDESTLKKFRDACDANIRYVNITYFELVSLLNNKSIFPEHETELQEIIADYESFIRNAGMLPNPYEMVVFPCGISWSENIKYEIYYEPSSRSSKAHVPYIGIYKSKTITHIGEIRATCISSLENESLEFNKEYGSITEQDKEKIKKVIDVTKYYDLSKGLERFYVIKNLTEVNITKQSTGGMIGHRYFDLQELSNNKIKPSDSIETVCKKLSGSSFS